MIKPIPKDSYLYSHLTHTDEGWYLRYDTDECDPKEQWDNFCEIADELRSFNLRLVDTYCEHDCITGLIVPLV